MSTRYVEYDTMDGVLWRCSTLPLEPNPDPAFAATRTLSPPLAFADGDVWNPVTHVFDPAPPPPPPPAVTVMTHLDFLNRLTLEEQVAFEMLKVQATVAGATSRVLDNQFYAAGSIDVADPRTIAGVQALAQLGIITADRVTALLAVAG